MTVQQPPSLLGLPPPPCKTHLVSKTGVHITLPPSVLAQHFRNGDVLPPSTTVSATGSVVSHMAPLSALVGSTASMSARPLHSPAPFTTLRSYMSSDDPTPCTKLLLSPRLNESAGQGFDPTQTDATQTDALGASNPTDDNTLIPSPPIGASHPSSPQLILSSTKDNQLIDISHTLNADASVYAVLSSCTTDDMSGRLIRGTAVTKHNAGTAGVSRRKIYLNFDDNTIRVQHTVPLFQSFMSETKGVFYLYKCFAACHWENSERGRDRMLRNRSYLDSDMSANTLCLVQRGGAESLVITFDTNEEYTFWLSGLRLLQMQSYQYHRFMCRELEKVSAVASLHRLRRSAGVWASLNNLARRARASRKKKDEVLETKMLAEEVVAECVRIVQEGEDVTVVDEEEETVPTLELGGARRGDKGGE